MRYIAFILALLLIAGCAQVPPGTVPPAGSDEGTALTGSYDLENFNPDANLAAKTFGSPDELASFVSQNQGSNFAYLAAGFDAVRTAEPMMETAVSGMAQSAPQVKAADDWDYSQTNNQVESVDEADLIKTDGEYIYTLSGNTLYIIKAYPGEEAEILSTVTLDNRPEDLFINGDKLAVFGTVSNYDYLKGVDFRPTQGMSFFDIYDVSDRSDPQLEEEMKFEGRYFRARMVDDYVYYVTTSYPEFRPIPMPVFIEGADVKHVPVSRVYYFPIPYDSTQFVTVHAIDIKDAEITDSATLAVESSQNLYMSEDNIYITYTKRVNEWQIQQEILMDLLDGKLTDSDRKLIDKIKKVDDDILNKNEKTQKIYSIYASYMNYLPQDEQEEITDKADELLKERLDAMEHLEYTVINKVSVKDGEIRVAANGEVPGYVNNQFSMDEYDGVFRIATTLSARWDRFEGQQTQMSNNVYTLDEDLNVMDSLEGLAENEQIYSTRFMGDRLYMVTFRQVDPFFVIDLSDPEHISSLGKLKIPGFSRYLHPYDDNLIIGIGQDASETGRTRGLKISLFDVSDVSDPKEVASWVSPDRYSSSNVLYEHRAFLFSKEKELLVLPAYYYDWQNEDESYNGALVFRITPDDIELRGLIDHSTGDRYSPSVERSLYIEDDLYTKSPNLLRINSLEDLHPIKDIDLKVTGGSMPVY